MNYIKNQNFKVKTRKKIKNRLKGREFSIKIWCAPPDSKDDIVKEIQEWRQWRKDWIDTLTNYKINGHRARFHAPKWLKKTFERATRHKNNCLAKQAILDEDVDFKPCPKDADWAYF